MKNLTLWKNSRGFALIATLSLMILIAIISIGLLTLSSVTLRTANADKNLATARANARLAMAVAIAELQKQLGKDQSVTAEASILDNTGFSAKKADAAKQHYVGVYSARDWNRYVNRSRGVWQPYNKDRNQDAMRSWLVSGAPLYNESAANSRELLDWVGSALGSGDQTTIVGKGTLGQNVAEQDQVKVPLVAIQDEKQKRTGSYGWWVGDESTKAKVTPPAVRTAMDPETLTRAQLGSPKLPNVAEVPALSGLNHTEASTVENLARAITNPTLALVAGVDREKLKSDYFAYTTQSASVLADVALGGLKRDLSLALEMPLIAGQKDFRNYSGSDPLPGPQYGKTEAEEDPTANPMKGFFTIWEFGNADRGSEVSTGGLNANKPPNWFKNWQGYVFCYPNPAGGSDYWGANQFLRGPSWRNVREYYREYKRDYEQSAANAVAMAQGTVLSNVNDKNRYLIRSYWPNSMVGDSYSKNDLSRIYAGDNEKTDLTRAIASNWDPFFLWGGNRGKNQTWNPMWVAFSGLSPVLTRMDLIVSYYVLNQGTDSAGNDKKVLRLVCDVVGSYWNPYNVTLEANSMFTQIDYRMLRVSLRKQAATGSTILLSGTGGQEIGAPPGNGGRPDTSSFPFNYLRVGTREENGSNIVFQPGEERVFSMDTGGDAKEYKINQSPGRPGIFSNKWSGGVRFEPAQNADGWNVKDVQQFILKIAPPTGEELKTSSYLTLSTHIGYLKSSLDTAIDPFTHNSNNQFSPEASGVHIVKPNEVFKNGEISVNITDFSNVATNGANIQSVKRPLFRITLRRQSQNEVPQNGQPYGYGLNLDPRAISNHGEATLGAGWSSHMPAGWVVNLSRINDFDDIQAGFGDRNYGYYQAPTNPPDAAQARRVLFDIPDAPLVSLGQLSNVQTAVSGMEQMDAIGSSFPNPNVPDLTALTAVQPVSYESVGRRYTHIAGPVNFTRVHSDTSYLSNVGLWDRYYFSGLSIPMPETVTKARELMKQFADVTKPNPLLNQHLVLAPNAREKSESRMLDEMTHYRWLANNVLLDGGFNVNSTSVNAWKAWLSSLKKTAITKLNVTTGQKTQTQQNDAFFPSMPVTAGNANELWRGFASISDSDVDRLATNLVEEVKLRGPFLSVADFVNRRLTNDETGRLGAIESAIEKANLVNKNSNTRGVTGTLRQSDILNVLGAQLVVRGDTFVVRAYGDARDSSGKTILARAYCEAVVQRTPELINSADVNKLSNAPNPDYKTSTWNQQADPGGIPAYIANPSLAADSVKFGRKFRVLSFRWLSPSEV